MRDILKYLPLLLFMSAAQNIAAQKAQFITHGKIEFEKKVNVLALIKEMQKEEPQSSWMEEWLDRFKKNNNPFQTTYFNLSFDNNHSQYKAGKENPENNNNLWFVGNEVDNITYDDFEKQQTVRSKHIYEDYFLITDSTRTINWKITNETRDIAGFTCRRANAVILDSVYVVAFYTDQITTPGGPESFQGLPGMILGVALPYEHITWFATKVEPMDDKSSITAPTKGKKVSYKEMATLLQNALKDWGSGAKKAIKNALL